MRQVIDKELIVRKVVISFIEKIFRFFGYDFNHDEFKAVIYCDKEYNTNTLEKIKRYYDGYMYLLENRKSPLTHSLLNTFHFILKEEELDKSFSNKILKHYFLLSENDEIKKAIKFHILIKEEFKSYDELDKLIIPLMMLNFMLVKEGVPTIKLVYANLIRYNELFEKRDALIDFLYKLIINYDFISKKFMTKLKPISLEKIIQTFTKDKDILKQKYHIKTLMIHGSFAKGLERIDSDIDLLVSINKDLLFEERVQIIAKIKEYYTKKFNRFVDIQEINAVLSDEFIKETKITTKIF